MHNKLIHTPHFAYKSQNHHEQGHTERMLLSNAPPKLLKAFNYIFFNRLCVSFYSSLVGAFIQHFRIWYESIFIFGKRTQRKIAETKREYESC